METRKYHLEERLLKYSAMIVHLVEKLPKTRAGNHIGGQLLRSGTSPLFNHREAQAAESADDFIHKLRVCLKELRETYRSLKLILELRLVRDVDSVKLVLAETEELIRIFVSSIKTVQNRGSQKGRPAGEHD